ncbi:MAG: hypothetical protein WB760_27225 [Xanthobacteraceae bacterium]
MFGSLFPQNKDRAPLRTFYRPYRNPGINQFYNLLFCDDFALFAGGELAGPLAAVLSDAPDRETLETIGNDLDAESRLRVLAFRRLRAMKVSVPRKRLLGVIIEWPQKDGLDVLAAFPDGRLRYINHNEKLAILESTPPDFVEKADELLRASQFIVNSYGPSDMPRLPPPTGDLIRMNFLVSDGLYFGQGSYSALMADRFAPPVIQATADLLRVLIGTAFANRKNRVLH